MRLAQSTHSDIVVPAGRFSPEERGCFEEGELVLRWLPPDHGYRWVVTIP